MEGQYVDEGMVLYELSDLSHVWVYLDVYEQDLRFVHLRQDVSVMADAYPGESFSGRVTFIDPVINPETRTVRVRADPYGKLKPNMYVKANVSIPIENALVIPTSAILSTGQRDVVWVEISKDSFVPREVMLGAKTEQFSQIVRGLSEGDMVAATGGYLIDSESSLQLPTGGDPHAGHGVSSPKEIRTEPAPAAVEFAKPGNNGVVTVPILVKGKYLPEEIHVKVGEKVRLDFFRDEDADCTNEVVFEGLQIRKRLPAREHTIIELTPTATGEIPFACGMGMVRGKLIVHK
jgi:Cu(I)/Ag(I) efflux system membrane fusion protein